MPIEEFARLYYAMSRVLEEATEPLGVSKRAGIVLLLLSQAPDGSLLNSDLVRKFGAWQLSKTREGASRDVSKANEELDSKGWISIHRGPYRVEITSEGQSAAKAVNDGIGAALARVTVSPQLRSLLESLVLDMESRKPPGQETMSIRPAEDAV